MDAETTSHLTKQASGIRALPSFDDSDTESAFHNASNSISKDNINPKEEKNSSSSISSIVSSSGGDSDNSDEGFVSGEEEFGTASDRPGFGGRDEETLQKSMVVGGNVVPVSGQLSGTSSFSARKDVAPIAKVSMDEDGDEKEIVRVEEEGSETRDGVGGDVPKVRVSEVGEDENGSAGGADGEHDKGLNQAGELLRENGAEESKGVGFEHLEEKKDDSDGVLDSNAIEEGSTKFTDEGAIVNPINTDKVKAVSSEATIVVQGGKDEDSETTIVEKTPLVEESASGDSKDVEGDGVKLTAEGDSVVDSIHVDEVEAVRSGAAVVGKVEEEKEQETKALDTPVVEGSASSDTKTVEEEEEQKTKALDTPVVEESASSDTKAVEGNGVKFTGEGDSVVESINVDVGEAVRSRAAIVGEVTDTVDTQTEEKEPEVEQSGQSRDANVELKNEFEPLGDMDSVGAGTEIDRDIKPASHDSEAAEPDSSRPNSDVAGEGKSGIEVEDTSVAEESALEDSWAVEAEGAKFTKQGDSMVASIHVDVGEAVKSGAAVVGEVGEAADSGTEEKEPKTTQMEPSLDVNVGLEDKFEHLVNVNSAGAATGLDHNVESQAYHNIEAAESDSSTLNSDVYGANKNENVDSDTVLCDVSAVDDFHEVKVGDLSSESEPSGTMQNEEKPKVEESKVEAGSEAKQYVDRVKEDNSADAMQSNSLAHGEKVPAVDHVNDASQGAEAEDVAKAAVHETQEEGDIGVSGTDEETDGVILSSGAATQFMKELEQASVTEPGVESSREHSERIDGQIVTDSEEEADSDEEGDEKEIFDSATLAALLKAATSAGSDADTITITSQDGSRLFSVERPAGLGSPLRAIRPSAAARPNNSNLFTPSSTALTSEENLSEEDKKKLENIQSTRVKYLRLIQRLGQNVEDSMAAQVLYRLTLLAGRPSSPAFSLDGAKQRAMQLEAEGKDDLDFSLNILVLGKTGVGKSATINSIFSDEKVKINAFEPGTAAVNEISGVVDGIKIRVYDTPGLKPSGIEQGFNRKILASVKKITKKCPPDVVLYVDRLDSQTRDLNDLPLLRTITTSLGSAIWRSAIVTLTHAASAPPDGPSGSPLSYEVFVAQRSHMVQQSIGQAVGDLRLMNPTLMNPVSLVENHPACRKNREGQKVLPNGQTWRPQLLLLCYSLKILSEASSFSKPQDPFDHRKLFGFRVRSPPLPYLLSSLLQPRAYPKLPAEAGADNGDSDIELDDLSDSDKEEEEDEYDQLPPFKPLRKSQIAKLSKEQRKAYFEEYDYRVKLLQKQQWREELKRLREMKKNGKAGADDYGQMPEDFDAENGAPAAVPVPLPDMVLPPSFDSDNPAYRYRFLEPTSQFLARPVLDTHGWDHDCGYDGVNVEQNLGIAGRFPAAVTVQVTKDKKEFSIHLDSAVSAKHGENGSSLAGFDIQTIGKQLAYIVRGETKFKNLKKNKTAAGASVTFLGENVATGVKLEDQIALGKRLVLVGSTGTVRSQKDAAYGANLEVRLREADYPIGQDQSSFVLSLMKWRGDLAIGANLQSQISVGRNSKMAVRVALNNKLSGQITVKTSSSDHLQLALAGLVPIAAAIYRIIKPGPSESYSIY